MILPRIFERFASVDISLILEKEKRWLSILESRGPNNGDHAVGSENLNMLNGSLQLRKEIKK